jgi:hypothetical protein
MRLLYVQHTITSGIVAPMVRPRPEARLSDSSRQIDRNSAAACTQTRRTCATRRILPDGVRPRQPVHDRDTGDVEGHDVLPAWSRAYTWTARNGEERRSIQTCVTVGRRAILAIGTTANRPARLRDDMPDLIRAIQSPRPVAIPSGPEPTQGGHNMSRGVVRRGSM